MPFKTVFISSNVVIIDVKIRNNVYLTAISLYMNSPLNEETTNAYTLVLDKVAESISNNKMVILGADMNMLDESKKVKTILQMLPAVLKTQ